MASATDTEKLGVIQLLYFRNLYDGGVAGAVPALSEALCGAGARVSLLTTDARPAWRTAPYLLTVHPSWKIGRAIDVNPKLLRHLRRAAQGNHVIHCHDVWSLQGTYAASAARHSGCRVVVSPRGSLAPAALRFSRWKKRLMWRLSRRRGVLAADCLHATSELEYEDIRSIGLPNPVAIIRNGIDVPPVLPEPTPPPSGRRRLLFLGRIHEKKGIDTLLRAWHDVHEDFPSWELQVVGPDDGYLPQALRLVKALGAQRIEFPGPRRGDERASAYISSQLFVLPSRSENFGSTVGEALAHGVPAITTRSTPWEGLETNACGWWIDLGLDSLTACLRDAMSHSPEGLKRMGASGRTWMAREFGWSRVGAEMLETYRWLLRSGEPPDWVRLE